ncbi:MAG: hypothetical protein INH37_00010 [Myxococcaceae bacterium]|jgi:hypothetical protein|nr:hypothetical protein [Myxococcaceae bacterium]
MTHLCAPTNAAAPRGSSACGRPGRTRQRQVERAASRWSERDRLDARREPVGCDLLRPRAHLRPALRRGTRLRCTFGVRPALPWLLLLLLCAACLESPGGPDAGAGLDAGTPPDAGLDAGAPPDAGPDAGAPPDAGPDAGAPPDAGPDGGLAADCSTRSGGAFVTVRSGSNDVFREANVRLWIVDAAFIAKAATLVGVASPSVFPMFATVIPRRDCDPAHAWHVDPSKAVFVELSREECDGHAGYVSANLDAWVARPKPDWCPWAAVIASVEPRP